MSLFSDLLKGKQGEQLKNSAQSLLGEAEKGFKKMFEEDMQPAQKTQPAQQAAPAQTAPAISYGASGDSWGENMPAEENQYSFNGAFTDYFRTVFEAEFPGYAIAMEPIRKKGDVFFTFTQGGRKALVVEIMSESCEAQMLKYKCAQEGVPYLRFYHDHAGWWNTRSYVVRRVTNALR